MPLAVQRVPTMTLIPANSGISHGSPGRKREETYPSLAGAGCLFTVSFLAESRYSY